MSLQGTLAKYMFGNIIYMFTIEFVTNKFEIYRFMIKIDDCSKYTRFPAENRY